MKIWLEEERIIPTAAVRIGMQESLSDVLTAAANYCEQTKLNAGDLKSVELTRVSVVEPSLADGTLAMYVYMPDRNKGH